MEELPTPSLLSHALTLKVLGLFAGAALAVGVLWMVTSPGMWDILLLPEELGMARLVADKEGTSTLYGRLSIQKSLEGQLVSATKGEGGMAHIVRTSDGEFQVFVGDKVVLMDATPRIGIARSPDGKRIAFAEAIDSASFVSTAEAPQIPLDRKSWRIKVYEPETRTTIDLGTGGSVVFLDNTHVAWLAPAGLAVSDLSTNAVKVLVEDLEGRVPSTKLFSPDRSIIGWYTAGSNALTLYRVTADSAEALPPVTVPTPHRSLVLGNDAVYVITMGGTGTKIIKQPFAGSAETIAELPVTLGINRLLLGSL